MKPSLDEWTAAQSGEVEYWGDQELSNPRVQQELKQQEVYEKHMDLPLSEILWDKKILDIGGGPVSMLLKYDKLGVASVIDPLRLTAASDERYRSNDIVYINSPAEEGLRKFDDKSFHEVWIYNVLAHVIDPLLILLQAKRVGKCLRIFEVLNIEKDFMHPWSLSREFFENVLGAGGQTVNLESGPVVGECYYGVFTF